MTTRRAVVRSAGHRSTTSLRDIGAVRSPPVAWGFTSDETLLLVRRLRRGHWVALDVMVAFVPAVAFASAAQLSDDLPQAVVALAALPVATRRGRPLPSLALSPAAAVPALLLGVESAFLPVAVVLYSAPDTRC
ncbi:hypothetical protein [Streptomyces turgidiscabies]|uniref:hypothetical protein n=1 Tax=Streptomyces turgidiscabies TaxID=85558 RepID=UPI0027D879C4|nr:hypothetical protein [Streptomyces turgidiscabies]